ncbi:hypothetical protein HYC85_007881 [Camellia sinensis]|uniref:Uncharacterized protein n=1 Tax=Camellia sinensis TaxID=4442 RepID=A0A7J7HR34_CAMSI|nr:hypothetical protein HYC85_007881 [Camellia sinensis]
MGVCPPKEAPTSLPLALGMVEHSGRVRGVGNFITPNSTSTFLDVEISSICEEKLKSFESIVLQMQAQINTMAQQRPQTSQFDDANSNTLKSDNIGNPQLVPNSKESRLLFKNDMSSSNPKQNIRPPNPKKNIKPLVFKLNIRKSKPCKLVVGSLENIVAHGTMYERTGPQEVIHTVPLGKFNV